MDPKFDINTVYHNFLLSKWEQKSPQNPSHLLKPTALYTPEELRSLPIWEYQELPLTEKYAFQLILRPMHAGIGSNIKRENFLRSFSENQGKKRIELSAKGVDLRVPRNFFSFPSDKIRKKEKDSWISLAEVHWWRAQHLMERQEYKKITIQNCVGPQTQKSLDSLWKEFQLSYQDLERKEDILQKEIPTIPFYRNAPGGHGLFAFQLLQELSEKNYDPGTYIILSNGEDISAFPDKNMLSYMEKEQIPLAMVVTDKSVEDKKGGLLSLWEKESKTFFQIYELAQAQMDGRETWFHDLGIKIGHSQGLFNTNMFLINANVLGNILKKELKHIQKPFQDWMGCIPFDLIQNKKQTPQGEKYVQLEAALASIFMGLDTYFYNKQGLRILHYLRVPLEKRYQFFTPIKSALDFYYFFFSQDFSWDPQSLKLKKVNNSFDLGGEEHVLREQNLFDVGDILHHFSQKS